MTTGSEQPRYRFGPLEKRGLIAGWRSGQVGIVITGMIVAVVLLRAERPPLNLFMALAVILSAVAAATWPIGGRTCEQWCPVFAGWALRTITGQHRHLSPVPVLGCPAFMRQGADLRRAARSGVVGAVAGRQPMPSALAGCRLLAPPAAAGGLRVGVVHDARARTYTGVVSVSGVPFALLEAEERHRRVAAWSALLASLAREGSPIHRLQWIERDLPGESFELTRQMASGMVVPADAPAGRSYTEVVERTGRLARSHQVLLALSIRAERSSREIRAFGGGDEGACALLARELRSLQSGLFGAEVLVHGALAPRTLAGVLRQAIDDWPRSEVSRDAAGDSGASLPAGVQGSGRAPEADPISTRVPRWPWPLASQTTWAAHRTDGTWHATYWVAEWPRVHVGPDFLSPVLLHSGVRHTMSVVMQPISPLKAARDVQQARTADLADAEIRRRGGFLATARRGKEAQAVTQREVELAEGHAEYRFSGYVTVSARSAEALDADCVRMEQAAGQARLELRRLFGQQDQAFTWTLPLGRGLS